MDKQSSIKRQVALDTETTGMNVEDDNRIISIGCVEILGRTVSNKVFYVEINPEREVEDGAQKVHGFNWDKLKNKPVFAQVVDKFLAFIKGSELLIHNAPYDVGFLDMELARLGRGRLSDHCLGIVDTLPMARSLRPGQRVSLDALCSAYGVNNTERKLHGAGIDAKLLAQVYLCMTRGQETLDINSIDLSSLPPMPPPDALKVYKASEEDLAAHAQTMVRIAKESKNNVVWID